MKETLKLALDEIKRVKEICLREVGIGLCNEVVIAKLEEALAQPEQEPVAWITQGGKGWLRWHKSYDDNKDSVPLYTTPPQRKPLTLVELSHIFASIPSVPFDGEWQLELARAIEAAHGIKE